MQKFAAAPLLLNRAGYDILGSNQLSAAGCDDRRSLPFHKAVLEGKLPLSIGGGIGQSRLCMYFLRKAHIGEVQVSVWPEEMDQVCRKINIFLL